MELDNWLERSRLLKQKLTDGQTDDGRKVITIAHLVRLRLSGELKITELMIFIENITEIKTLLNGWKITPRIV